MRRLVPRWLGGVATNGSGIKVTQRELLGLILGCAAKRSASFPQALYTVSNAIDTPDPGALARELLTDLTIRDWIVLVRADPDGTESALPRTRYEMELGTDTNWHQFPRTAQARYVVTEKGREKIGPLLATLRQRPTA